MSRIVRKPDFCLCKNKGADQLRSNCKADQRLCFHYMDSTISLLLKSERGGLTVYEIYIGFCPRTDFYDIMHIACWVHDHLISNIDFLLTT